MMRHWYATMMEKKFELRDITLKWRGSSNQRVIDVKRSLKQGKVILWENQ